ncbi:curli production assembly/transport component CsgF [Larkinella sp.]|uniref:curli production assembly/transport component CsgF n=1 Tax=Larkinella sp. TaxID=2034517 RepID=UPI003BA98104
MKKLVVICSLLLGFISLKSVQAQSLTYQPKNPAFGGNTFNYQWLLSSAQAQDQFKDPAATKTASGAASFKRSPVDEMTESLQRQLMSRITRDLIEKQFGEDGLKEGTFQFGDMQVVISNSADGVNIRVNDGKGGESNITVPYF